MQLSTTESAWTFIFGLQSDASASLKSVCQHYMQCLKFKSPRNARHSVKLFQSFLLSKVSIFG